MDRGVRVADTGRQQRQHLALAARQCSQEYLRGMFVEAAARPTVDDVLARARARVGATGARVDTAALLDARDAERR